MADEFDVAAVELLCEGTAGWLRLSSSGQTKLNLRMTGRLLDDQFHSLPCLKGSGVEHDERGWQRRFRFAWKEEPPVDPIVNRPRLNSESAVHGFSHVSGVGKNCVCLANGASCDLGSRFIHDHHYVGDHGDFQSKLAAQRKEDVIHGPEPRIEINVGSRQQQTCQESPRVSVRTRGNEQRVGARGYPGIRLLSREHGHTKALRRKPGHNFFHRQLLSIGVGRVGMGRREDRGKSRRFAHSIPVNPWLEVRLLSASAIGAVYGGPLTRTWATVSTRWPRDTLRLLANGGSRISSS